MNNCSIDKLLESKQDLEPEAHKRCSKVARAKSMGTKSSDLDSPKRDQSFPLTSPLKSSIPIKIKRDFLFDDAYFGQGSEDDEDLFEDIVHLKPIQKYRINVKTHDTALILFTSESERCLEYSYGSSGSSDSSDQSETDEPARKLPQIYSNSNQKQF